MTASGQSSSKAAPRRALLLGADGMLGRAWRERLRAEKIEHAVLSYPEFDLAQPMSVTSKISAAFDLVINCAAWTDVDGAEAQEGQARQINGEAVGELARSCRDVGATLIHYSTDYVFDGRSTTPYPVSHPRSPVNAYGRSKALGEQHLEAHLEHCLMIRTSWLYAAWGNNFVRTMLRLGAERPQLRVVDDQRGRPTSARWLAEASLALFRAGERGVHHVCDGGECSWYEFATAILAATQPSCEVVPCASDEYPRPAPRPAYSVLDLSVSEAVLGASAWPSWRENLAAVLDENAAGNA